MNASLARYNGNKRFLLERVGYLNQLRTEHNLSGIVEFGYSPTLCSMLDYKSIIVIERLEYVCDNNPNYRFIVGNYYERLHDVLMDNTCYTYFLADSYGGNPPLERTKEEADRKETLPRVLDLLSSACLSNSFLCVWHRKINHQSVELIKL